MDFAAGISLLSIKHELMLGYIHTLALLNAHRALGHSLAPEDDAPPALPGFGNAEREERGRDFGAQLLGRHPWKKETGHFAIES